MPLTQPSHSLPCCPSIKQYIPKFRGLLVDAAGTLLIPSEPAAEVRQMAAADWCVAPACCAACSKPPTLRLLPGVPANSTQVRLRAVGAGGAGAVQVRASATPPRDGTPSSASPWLLTIAGCPAAAARCSRHPPPAAAACREAYNTPWGRSTIRYVGDGRPFWRHIVQASTGCCNDEMFEEVRRGKGSVRWERAGGPAHPSPSRPLVHRPLTWASLRLHLRLPAVRVLCARQLVPPHARGRGGPAAHPRQG